MLLQRLITFVELAIFVTTAGGLAKLMMYFPVSVTPAE
jgi:hypothetical protein